SLLRPDYLSYVNQVSGGPKAGYKHLVDSSLDWGQDLPILKNWLDHHFDASASTRLYLAYFGTALPRSYGIEATPLPVDSSTHKLSPLEPGTNWIRRSTVRHPSWHQVQYVSHALTSILSQGRGGREAPGDGSPLVERTEHRRSKAESAVIANLDEIET